MRPQKTFRLTVTLSDPRMRTGRDQPISIVQSLLSARRPPASPSGEFVTRKSAVLHANDGAPITLVTVNMSGHSYGQGCYGSPTFQPGNP